MRRSDGKLRVDSKLHGRLDEAAALYAKGKSTKEIAAIFGLHHSNVYRIFKSRGITMRGISSAIKTALRTGRAKPLVGAANHAWRGGRTRHQAGYVLMRRPDHPRAHSGGYVYEHILVAEQAFGRPVQPDEVVHHLNGIRDDNRFENLDVMTHIEHGRLHARLQHGRIGINHPHSTGGNRT